MVFSSQTGSVGIIGHLNRPRGKACVETQIEKKTLHGSKMRNGYAAGTPRFTEKVKAIVNKKQDATAEEMKFATEFVDGLPPADDESTDDDANAEDDNVDNAVNAKMIIDNANAEDDTVDNANATVEDANAETSASEEE